MPGRQGFDIRPFYRRLLYFANLLLCSAAILKKEKDDRPYTEKQKKRKRKEREEWIGGLREQLVQGETGKDGTGQTGKEENSTQL